MPQFRLVPVAAFSLGLLSLGNLAAQPTQPNAPERATPAAPPTASPSVAPGLPAAAATSPACAGCGHVSAVVEQEREGPASVVGAIAGSAAGALLGQQLGAGLGRDLATLAGAVGGAYAGREIEKKVRSRRVWVVTVQYGGGQTAQFEFEQEPDLKVGDAVRNSGSSVVRN